MPCRSCSGCFPEGAGWRPCFEFRACGRSPVGSMPGRGAPALSGARYSRSLGSRGGGRVPVTTAVLSSEAVRQALRQVKDPELDMNIVDLGLVYDVEVDDGLVRINMTLTSPGCPAGPMITNDIYRVVRAMEGVKDVDIDIVWEPYWTPDRIDPKIRAMMGF